MTDGAVGGKNEKTGPASIKDKDIDRTLAEARAGELTLDVEQFA
jgi:hypothetical protein